MPLILSDPFLQRDQDVVPLGALVPPFTPARKKTLLPSLVLAWLVPRALTGLVLEKEPTPRFHGTLCASQHCSRPGSLCHPDGT